MTGVPRTVTIGGEAFNTEHRINKLKHLEPVKQKKRSLAPERNEAIHTQVEELTKANILREVKYQTWVSNLVIMKKASGRWKLCVDFTNISKAYPKEHHSLLMIKKKFEDLHRHRLKCFLDAYKGYHQIPIAEKDEEKTAFYTREGVFCYRILPFDDIVIKSDVEEEMLADIKETLDGLRAINLKLNPKKCSFGVEEGIFSRHLITKQGIKASPSKVKAISDLQPHKSVSEIQNLNKKLAALNRFLSKGVDKTLLFMRTLKSCKSGKMVQWTAEADKAFRRMEELLEALPTVTAPIKGETLIMYLAASEKSISAILMAKRGKKQILVYFVLSDKLLKQILARLEKSGRIAKWAIELGEHEIEFRRRNSVKGQILADFLAETPSKEEEGVKDKEAKRKEPEQEKVWKLFIDGASSSDGSEAGLRIAKEMRVQELTIFIDSQLVANQVNGLFEARQTVIKQYLEKAKELLAKFPCHSIEHIKRDQNKKADALSKLASMTFSKLAKEVLVEVIQDKSITQKEVANVTQEKEDIWMIPIREYL
ncbi:reverse transcriptase domain-containing protein [Tanacetum coccineum]